ncbi:MAG: hypothetical protein KGV44_02155 [Flavobacteriaceae bacterium]|nr:hypothetical protein [Flavobacteriaceae bacterium]
MKYTLKPLGLLGIGMSMVLLGAIAKMMKEDFASVLLSIGMILEVIGIIYFIRFYKIKIEKK